MLYYGALPLWAFYCRSKRKKTDYHYNQEPKKHTKDIQNSASTETESNIKEKQPQKKTQISAKKATKSAKGQLILKCLFGVFNSSKKTNKHNLLSYLEFFSFLFLKN